MAPKPEWTISESAWLTEIKLPTSALLPALVEKVFVRYPLYAWRGHRCADWKLEPTLGRKTTSGGKRVTPQRSQLHLQDFKLFTRGRLIETPATEDEWWALGQHHGLATPLLDWTSSPFVGAYFAFIGQGIHQTAQRAIWGLSRSGIHHCSRRIVREWRSKKRRGNPPVVELVRSGLFAGNKRLLSQSGMFTKAPDGLDLETWSKLYAARHFPDRVLLVKILIPDADREPCLRMLDRMNINHHSLFPDVDGAARYCNTILEIDKYH